MKVVPDTVMWVSYATHADGARSRAIERAIGHRVRLITSEYILTEVERVLALNLSQQQLARLAGVRQETISRLETGKHTADPRTMDKLCAAMEAEGRRRKRMKAK